MTSRTLLAAALLAAASIANAQPIRLIVPYPPGGPLDIVARALAEKLQPVLGTVIVDNWNNIVRSIRSNPSLIQSRGAASINNASMSPKANAAVAGDVMMPKINGVKLLRQPKDGAAEIQTLTRNDEVLMLGDEQNGFVKVTAPRGDGWIKAILLRKP